MKQLVKVIVTLENDEKEVREYKVSDLKFKPRKKDTRMTKEELREIRELERLEKTEGKSKLDDE